MENPSDFESCLEALEAHGEEQRIVLGGKVSEILTDGERVLCGLESDGLSLMTMGKDILKLESSGMRSKIACLSWIGRDKCISAHYDGTCRVWDLVQCKEVAVINFPDLEEDEYQGSIAVTADGHAVFGSSASALRLWNLAQLEQTAKSIEREAPVVCICLIDEKCISGNSHGSVTVRDLHTLQELAELRGHTTTVRSLAATSKGQVLSTSEDSTVRLWDLLEYKEVACYQGHQSAVSFVREIDADRCLSGGFDECRVWSTKDLSDIHRFPFIARDCEVQKDVLFFRISTGAIVVSALTYQIIATIDVKCFVSFAHYFAGKCACISENTVLIAEVDQYQQVSELRGHSSCLYGALPCGSDRLISWSADMSLKVWDVIEQRELAALTGHSSYVRSAALTADGRCVSGDDKGVLKVWDLAEMKEIPTSMKHESDVQQIAVTRDGKAIAADSEGNVSVWSLSSYAKVGELSGHTGRVSCIALPSDEVAVTGSQDRTLRVWSVAKCAALATLGGHQGPISAIALASHDRCVCAEKTVEVWDLHKYTLLATLKGHSTAVRAVAVTGEKCVSGSTESIIVWSLINYQQMAKLACKSSVYRIAFISDTVIATGHQSGKVKVWDECREVASFKGHSSAITSLALVSDFRLAATSYDEIATVCDLRHLSNCLSLCREALEVREGKSVQIQYRSRIPDFRSGKRVPAPECRMLFRPYFFNSLHFCAYFNHAKLLAAYLKEKVPLVRGVFGSPLTLALERNAIGCVDALLGHLISVAAHRDTWKSFQAINEDLPTLLNCDSSILEAFFGVFFQHPAQKLPDFIAPIVPLPLAVFVAQPCITEYEVFDNASRGTDLVKFSMSLVSWNFVAGSEKSIELLTAAVECEEKRVLVTDFFRTIIEQKWANCFPFTLCVALAYTAMLACLLGTLNLGSKAMCIGYLVLNGFFALFEIAQILAMKSRYITDGWNAVDSVRSILSII